MGFNENAFMIAGTAIAIFGVGVYLWDTRKGKVMNAYNNYVPQQQPQMSQYAMVPRTGGSRKSKRRNNKTRRHK